MTLIKTPDPIIATFADRFSIRRVIHKDSPYYQKYFYKVCYELDHVVRLFMSGNTHYYDNYYRKPRSEMERIGKMQAPIKPVLARLIKEKKIRTIVNVNNRFSLFTNDVSVFDALAGLDEYLVRKQGVHGPTVIGTICPSGTIKLATSPYKFRCYLARGDQPVEAFESLADHAEGISLSGAVCARIRWTASHVSKTNGVRILAGDYFDSVDSGAVTYAMLLGLEVSKVVNIVQA